MQIIIELRAKDEKVIHSDAEQKEWWEKSNLTRLMSRLEGDDYRINTLYGNFVFGEEKKEVVDCGKPGEIVPACFQLADAIFRTGGKLAIIFIDKKYIVFANRYFVAMHFCHMRKVRPLSIYDVLTNYDELIINENEELLDKLYFEKFELYYGKGAEAVSCFKGDYKVHTRGYAIAGEIEEEGEK